MHAAVAAAAGRVPVMTSIQHTDVREVLDLVRSAGDAGIDGVQLGATYYYPATEDDFLRLADLVSRATRIPLMAYSTWWEGGHVMTPDHLRRLAEIEHLDAVKWSAPTHDQFTAGAAAVADRLVLIDNMGVHVWGHLLGVRGFVTHVGNFWPEYTVDLWHELERRDYEAATRRLASFKWAWSEIAGRIASHTGGEGPFIKAALEVAGLHAGPPRPPSAPATDRERDDLRELFARAGLPTGAVAAA
jgi:4-hydroxy-tetrahydrodipicolinate synthase